MNLDKDLYTKIFKTVAKVAKSNRYDKQIIEDITQDVSYRLLKAFKNPDRKKEIKNEMAYIYSVIISTFADYYRDKRRKKFNPNDVDWLNDIAESYDIIPENQARSFFSIIDDYVRKHPKSFTKQNQQLWDIFKQQKYTAQEMMVQMGMSSPASIHTAKARLMKRIGKICKEIARSDPD